MNEIAYISDINNGIQLINVSRAANLNEITLHTYENCGTNDIFVQGKILFIADRNIGLLIFNTTQNGKTSTTTSSSSGTGTTTTVKTPLSNIWICVLFGMCMLIKKRKTRRFFK